MTENKNLDDLLTILSSTAKIVGRELEKLADKAIEGIDNYSEKVVEAYNKEKTKLPKDLSEAEKAGAVVGKLIGKGVDYLAKRFYKEEQESPIKCYKVVPKQPKECCVKVGSKEVLTIWREGPNYFAAVDTSVPDYEKIFGIYCDNSLKTEVSSDKYQQYLQKKKKRTKKEV